MKLAYHNKQTEKEILDKIPEIDTPQLKEIVGKNLLLKGENPSKCSLFPDLFITK